MKDAPPAIAFLKSATIESRTSFGDGAASSTVIRPAACNSSTSTSRSPSRSMILFLAFLEPTSRRCSLTRLPAPRKPTASANSSSLFHRYEMWEWSGTLQPRIPRSTLRARRFV